MILILMKPRALFETNFRTHDHFFPYADSTHRRFFMSNFFKHHIVILIDMNAVINYRVFCACPKAVFYFM